MGSHAVVWLRSGEVLDPMCDSPKRLSDFGEPGAIAGVHRVGPPIETGPLTYLHWSFMGGGKTTGAERRTISISTATRAPRVTSVSDQL